MNEVEGRRPIGARKTRWAQNIARRLARSAITPNQISAMSVAFAVLAATGFYFAGNSEGGTRIALLITAVFGVQLRLLCNLFDGMVAIEGGKAEKDGAFWNEAPDRFADIVILVGAGYGPTLYVFGPQLGWAAATFAVSTAYIRQLGRAVQAPADYGGPMAKQQRMAVVTIGAVAAAVEPAWEWAGRSMTLALAIVAVGSALTALLRARRLVRFLRT